MIEKLNVAEKNRYKVIQHVIEQRKQHKFYSTKIKQLHNIVLQTDILSYVDDSPEVDNIRYAQAIDEERDKNEAMEDTSIPEELKAQAEKYTDNFLDPDSSKAKPGAITNFYAEIGRQARKKI